MSSLKIKFKKTLTTAKTPTKANPTDACFDFYAATKSSGHLKYIEYDTGIAIEIPEGHVGLVFPRSSLSNYDLILSNAVGVIDPLYRGSIKFRFKRYSRFPHQSIELIKEYHEGDRIGQLMIIPIPQLELEEVEEFGGGDRGGGFGSSGK